GIAVDTIVDEVYGWAAGSVAGNAIVGLQQFLPHDVFEILKRRLKDFGTFLYFRIPFDQLDEGLLFLACIRNVRIDPDKAREGLVSFFCALAFSRGEVVLNFYYRNIRALGDFTVGGADKVNGVTACFEVTLNNFFQLFAIGR